MKKERKITAIMVLFIAYISILTCKTTQIVLYGGYALVMVTLLIRVMFGDGGRLIVPQYTKQLLLFVVYSVASVFWSFRTIFVLSQIPLLIACGLLVIMMGDYVIKKKAEDAILGCIAICGLALALYVIYDYGGFAEFYREATTPKNSLEAQRLGGDVNNVNIIGIQCCFSTIVLFYLAIIRGKKICFVLMFVPFVMTFATGSRKALVLLIVGLVAVVYYKISMGNDSKKYVKIYFGILAIIAFVFFLLSLDIAQTSTERLASSLNLFSDSKATDGSAQLRYDMIITGLKQSKQHPVLGWGLANSRAVNALYLGYSTYSHCDYIEIMLNGGLLGFLLYYTIFWKMLKEYINLLKKDSSDSVVFISMLIMILFLIFNVAAVTYYGRITTFVYFIMWISVLEIRKRDNENEILSESNKQINE